ncbi:MAG: DUF4129 domain-containing protein [Alphaproteobacteria bacterium]|nr:DUF4129 domain-containing protein [Alphaproteobacteria bacterium]
MIRNSAIVRELVALSRPVLLYWLTCVLGLVVFSAALLMTKDSWDEKAVIVIGTIWGSTALGVLLGQVASVTRIRSGIFLPAMFFAFWFAVYVIATAEPMLNGMFGEGPVIVLFLGSMLGSMMASGGFWSLRVNRGLVAAWAPAILFTGGILIFTENSGRVEAWHEGAKYAIWSAGTVSILALAIVLQLLFMGGRERHRVHRWLTAPQAPEHAEQRSDPFRPFAGLGTLLMLGVLVVALTGSSAIVAPYLWRTGPPDDDGNPSHGVDPDDDPAQPNTGGGGGPNLQKVMKYVQQGAQMGCALLTMLILAVAGLIVFGPPTRRQLLLSHLRDPMWPVPPSRRARLHWRLAEIALGDAGIYRKPGDSARDVALRAVERYPDVNLEALVTAAEIADRVMYGYALDAGDADTIRRAAEMTYQAVWDNLGEAERLKATYRLL